MKYRYNKIAALLGENLDDPEVRFKVTVILYLYAYSLTPAGIWIPPTQYVE